MSSFADSSLSQDELPIGHAVSSDVITCKLNVCCMLCCPVINAHNNEAASVHD